MTYINTEDEGDTRSYRRINKIRGPRGTDWWRYFNGVPPEDDCNDYSWIGSYWIEDNYEDEY